MRRRRRSRTVVYFPSPYYTYRAPKRYGIFDFVVDAGLTILTSGLWLIWVFVREMRKP